MRYQDLKVGMWVKIVRKVDDYHTDADGIEWDNVWVADMNGVLGEEFIVGSIRLTGVKSVASGTEGALHEYCWPWASLEEVSE